MPMILSFQFHRTALAVGVALLIAMSVDYLFAMHTPVPEPKRATYVIFADDPADTRGYNDFLKMQRALDRLAPRDEAARVQLDYLGVVYGDGIDIDSALRVAARTAPIAIIATSYDVLEAAKRSAPGIPLLFLAHEDPVRAGHVNSLAFPGVQRTGFTYYRPMLQKALEVLSDAYPHVRRVGIVLDTLLAEQAGTSEELAAAKTATGLELEVVAADRAFQLAEAISHPPWNSVDAWYVPAGAALWYDKAEILALMTGTGLPVLYNRTFLVTRGGLMSYEARLENALDIWARQLTLIVQGVDPATIPIEQSSRFELAFNLDAMRSNPALRPSKRFLQRVDRFVASE